MGPHSCVMCLGDALSTFVFALLAISTVGLELPTGEEGLGQGLIKSMATFGMKHQERLKGLGLSHGMGPMNILLSIERLEPSDICEERESQCFKNFLMIRELVRRAIQSKRLRIQKKRLNRSNRLYMQKRSSGRRPRSDILPDIFLNKKATSINTDEEKTSPTILVRLRTDGLGLLEDSDEGDDSEPQRTFLLITKSKGKMFPIPRIG